jgi:DNA-binding CsgD family transcriptional regulator
LVDKSLVVADDTDAGMRYRLLETVRQYAQEKLGQSGEADQVRTRHRDHYTTTAARLESTAQPGDERLMAWAEVEIDNLRAAFTWSRENSDLETGLRLVSSLQQFWLTRGRFQEGLAGFDTILTEEPDPEIALAVWVRAVADHSTLSAWMAVAASPDRAREALALARQLDDPALTGRALVACGSVAIHSAEVAQSYFAEATELVRTAGDRWSLCQILAYLATAGYYAGEPIAAAAAAEEGYNLADTLGDRFFSRTCRLWLASALAMQADLADAVEMLRSLAEETEVAGDLPMSVMSQAAHSVVLAYQGEAVAAQGAAQSALRATNSMAGIYADAVYGALATVGLAAGETAAARQAAEAAWRHTVPLREVAIRGLSPMAEAALACGDLAAARRWADDTVAVVPGWYRMVALTVRAYIAIAQGEPSQADRDAHDALAVAARTRGYLRANDTLECLVRLAADDGNHPYAARLLGAAEAIRQRTGEARFPMYQAGYDAAVAAVRDALGQNNFDAARAEGAVLSTEEAIAYAQRGRGERKRPTSGWGSLTPMENDVVRLVREGLGNKDIGARLFISPRTVQTHLTHVYAKLGLTSRVQLVQEAGRHG